MGWFSGFRAVSFAADSGPARIGRLGTSVEDAAWSCQTIATTRVSPAGLASRLDLTSVGRRQSRDAEPEGGTGGGLDCAELDGA